MELWLVDQYIILHTFLADIEKEIFNNHDVLSREEIIKEFSALC